MAFRIQSKGEALAADFADNEYVSGTIHSLAKKHE
jgi:hypothetical protein